MGQREPCRAQLVIWSRVVLFACQSYVPFNVFSGCSPTYSAYCAKPFFPSWLGSGTSRRSFLTGRGAPGPCEMRPGVCVTCPALLDEELEIQAAGAARNGRSAVMGLAAQMYQYRVQLRIEVVARGNSCVPRSANAAVDRVVENIFERACNDGARGRRGRRVKGEWRGGGMPVWSSRDVADEL
jgi:hypothetical protein